MSCSFLVDLFVGFVLLGFCFTWVFMAGMVDGGDDSLASLWEYFSLTEKEKIDVVVDKEWMLSPATSGLCLVGRLLIKQGISMEVFSGALGRIWHLEKDLEIKDIADGTYVFHFADKGEMEQVFKKQPWSFSKTLLVLHCINKFISPDNFVSTGFRSRFRYTAFLWPS